MIEYLLFEQKYMELIASGSTIEAIQVLQTKSILNFQKKIDMF